MGNASLAVIQRRIDAAASAIGAPPGALPTYGRTEDGARPHIEVDGPLYHYVVVERGKELLRETFSDVDELLGRVFEDVTFQMAGDYEVEHRRPQQDFRRQLFAKQLEYLSALNPKWAERRRVHLNRVLAEHPFSDDLGVNEI